MSGCTHYAGPGMRIHFDGDKLCVSTLIIPFPGFLGHWGETKVFTNEREWYESEYSDRVTNEQVEEMILWHWIDLTAEESEQTPD